MQAVAKNQDPLLAPPHPFKCVQMHIYDRIDATGGIEPRKSGNHFLSLVNLEFIFYKFLQRFSEETGATVLPENQSLELFAELIFEAYFGMLDSFDYEKRPSDEQLQQNVAAWNKNTIDWLLVSTMRPYQRHQNYLKRYRNYKYGMGRIVPIRMTSKKTKRVEENIMQNYSGIGTTLGKPLYPVNDTL